MVDKRMRAGQSVRPEQAQLAWQLQGLRAEVRYLTGLQEKGITSLTAKGAAFIPPRVALPLPFFALKHSSAWICQKLKSEHLILLHFNIYLLHDSSNSFRFSL